MLDGSTLKKFMFCHHPSASRGGRSSLHLGGMFDFLGACFCRGHPFERHVTWPPRNGGKQNCYERNTPGFGVGISSACFLHEFDVGPSISIICNDLRRMKVVLFGIIYFSLNFEDLVKTLGISKDHGLEHVVEIILQTRHEATLSPSSKAIWCHRWWYVLLDPYHRAKPVVESFCTLGMDTLPVDSNEQEVSGPDDTTSQINVGFVIWDDLGRDFAVATGIGRSFELTSL